MIKTPDKLVVSQSVHNTTTITDLSTAKQLTTENRFDILQTTKIDQ